MNIQPVGSPAIARPEDRPASAVGQPGAVAAVAGSTAAADMPASREDVSGAVKKINDSPLGTAQGLEFSIDEDTDVIVVKVIDQSTREVVRQMPSKEALEIAKSLDKMQGLLIRETA